MKNLFITSINPGVGKSTFTMALALRLQEDGINVGYFKPITDSPKDTDALETKKLLKLDDDLALINPVILSPFEYDMDDDRRLEVDNKLTEAYNTLNAKYDLLLIEGCRKINFLAFLDLSVRELAPKFNAKVIVVSSGEEIEDTDRLILAKHYLTDDSLVGAMFTMVPSELFQHFKTIICPKLFAREKIKVFGLIPNRATLVAPTVNELQSTLGAQILASAENMDKMVEDYVIGAMMPESALKYFRKSVNKAVITGGDRPQVALAAMETDTSVVILTGSIRPPAAVLAKAEEKGIPVLLVAGDTFSTVKKITEFSMYGKIKQGQEAKLDAWKHIFDEVDYKDILKRLE